MRKATKEEMKKEFQVFNDVWKFCKTIIESHPGLPVLSLEEMLGISQAANELNSINTPAEPELISFKESLLVTVVKYFTNMTVKLEGYTNEAAVFNGIWKIFQEVFFVDYEDDEDWNVFDRLGQTLLKSEDCKVEQYNILAHNLLNNLFEYVTATSYKRFLKATA